MFKHLPFVAWRVCLAAPRILRPPLYTYAVAFVFDVSYFLCNLSILLYLMNWFIGLEITLRPVHVIHQIRDGQLENGNARQAAPCAVYFYSCLGAPSEVRVAKIHNLYFPLNCTFEKCRVSTIVCMHEHGKRSVTGLILIPPSSV